MTRIRIPFNGETAEHGLGRAVQEAARAAGVTFSQVAIIGSYLFEHIADRVACGELVTIPGFGQFQPWATQSRWSGERYVQPRFMAAMAFRNTVKVSCLLCNACNAQAETYRTHHTLRLGSPLTASRTFTAMDAFRVRIRAQAKREGEESELQRAGP